LFLLSQTSVFSYFPDSYFPDSYFPDSYFPDSYFPDSYFPDLFFTATLALHYFPIVSLTLLHPSLTHHDLLLLTLISSNSTSPFSPLPSSNLTLPSTIPHNPPSYTFTSLNLFSFHFSHSILSIFFTFYYLPLTNFTSYLIFITKILYIQ